MSTNYLKRLTGLALALAGACTDTALVLYNVPYSIVPPSAGQASNNHIKSESCPLPLLCHIIFVLCRLTSPISHLPSSIQPRGQSVPSSLTKGRSIQCLVDPLRCGIL